MRYSSESLEIKLVICGTVLLFKDTDTDQFGAFNYFTENAPSLS